MRWIGLVVLLFGLVACGTPTARDRIAGTWESDLMTLTFDFDAATITGIAGGNAINSRLGVVREQANAMVITASNDTRTTTSTLMLQEDGRLLMQQEGAIPILFRRSE